MDLYFDTNGNGLIDSGERLQGGQDNDNIARTLEAGIYFLEVNIFSSSSTRYDLTLGIN